METKDVERSSKAVEQLPAGVPSGAAGRDTAGGLRVLPARAAVGHRQRQRTIYAVRLRARHDDQALEEALLLAQSFPALFVTALGPQQVVVVAARSVVEVGPAVRSKQ